MWPKIKTMDFMTTSGRLKKRYKAFGAGTAVLALGIPLPAFAQDHLGVPYTVRGIEPGNYTIAIEQLPAGNSGMPRVINPALSWTTVTVRDRTATGDTPITEDFRTRAQPDQPTKITLEDLPTHSARYTEMLKSWRSAMASCAQQRPQLTRIEQGEGRVVTYNIFPSGKIVENSNGKLVCRLS